MPGRTRSLIATLTEVAWADGILRPQEAAFFVDVVSRLELPAEEEALIYRGVLSGSTDTDDAVLDADDRRWVLGFGYLMAAVDGDVDPREIAALQLIAARLGINSDEAQALFADARSLASLVPK